jgi:hypothetical protein
VTPDEIQVWFEENDPPFVLKTQGGRSYRITNKANVWLPVAYQTMLCVAVVGRGITMIKISAIKSIQIEHDVASAR